jgi:hypothetical protein
MQRRTRVLLGAAVGMLLAVGFRVWQRRRDGGNRLSYTPDEVELASDDSFPASDPPSYTPASGSVAATS